MELLLAVIFKLTVCSLTFHCCPFVQLHVTISLTNFRCDALHPLLLPFSVLMPFSSLLSACCSRFSCGSLPSTAATLVRDLGHPPEPALLEPVQWWAPLFLFVPQLFHSSLLRGFFCTERSLSLMRQFLRALIGPSGQCLGQRNQRRNCKTEVISLQITCFNNKKYALDSLDNVIFALKWE